MEDMGNSLDTKKPAEALLNGAPAGRMGGNAFPPE